MSFLLSVVIYLIYLIIRYFVRQSAISEAESIKSSYPNGVARVIGTIYSMDYDNAKRIVENRSRIVSAQREYEEEQRKAAEARRIKTKSDELKHSCPYATKGKTNEYIAYHESEIRQIERRHEDRLTRAKRILQDYPLGASAVCGSISTYLGISDTDIDMLINNESTIRVKQREREANKAEVESLQPELSSLRHEYPLACKAIIKEIGLNMTEANDIRRLLLMRNVLPAKETSEYNRILGNKNEYDTIISECRAKIERPNGRTLIKDKYGSLADRVFEVFDSEKRIESLKSFSAEVIKSQTNFASATRRLFPDIINGWGYYYYDGKVSFKEGSFEDSKSFRVWEPFCEAYCTDNSVSYEYYSYLKDNRAWENEFKNRTRHFNPPVYDKILRIITKIQESNEEKIVVYFANTERVSAETMRYHYQYLQNKLSDTNIEYTEDISRNHFASFDVCYIVIDLITTNANLISLCSSIMQERCDIKSIRENTRTTNILFISLLKRYDKDEVVELNKAKEKEAREAEEKKRREEEERRQNEFNVAKAKEIARTYPIGFRYYFPSQSTISISVSEAKSIVQKESSIRDRSQLISRLKNNVSSWDTVAGIPHYFFYYYYPTRFTDISPVSQEARRLVYNFKDGNAHNNVKELVVSKIRSTFSPGDISKLTFVCIPASTRAVHQNRYQAFSRDVCSDLGIRNAYEYITITKEKTPSHLGGSDSAEYSYDRSFFDGALVILFDDIVTRGRSMSSMKSHLESLGATVVCALSIGRTYSDYYGDTRKPHPHTGTL